MCEPLGGESDEGGGDKHFPSGAEEREWVSWRVVGPLVLQTVLIFFVAYGWAKWWKLPHDVAAPAGMIGASNFFELAVAVAISLFGLQSGAALATVVGVLVEVPVMLMLVRIANNTRSWFPATK